MEEAVDEHHQEPQEKTGGNRAHSHLVDIPWSWAADRGPNAQQSLSLRCLWPALTQAMSVSSFQRGKLKLREAVLGCFVLNRSWDSFCLKKKTYGEDIC